MLKVPILKGLAFPGFLFLAFAIPAYAGKATLTWDADNEPDQTVVYFASAASQASKVTLTWDANNDPNLAGYIIYYGTSSGQYTQKINVGKVTTATVTGPQVGSYYFFAVAAYNLTKLESAFSNEVMAKADVPTVYEDAEDGTAARWFVYDNRVPGAKILNVFDAERGSRVIQLSGSAWANGYWLRNANGSPWHNSTQHIVQWSMKFSEYFEIFMDVQTTAGHRYIYYTDYPGSALGSGEYVHHGLGRGAKDGQWHTFTRDLQADLSEAQPGVVILEVNGFLIRGSGMVDEIKLKN